MAVNSNVADPVEQQAADEAAHGAADQPVADLAEGLRS